MFFVGDMVTLAWRASKYKVHKLHSSGQSFVFSIMFFVGELPLPVVLCHRAGWQLCSVFPGGLHLPVQHAALPAIRAHARLCKLRAGQGVQLGALKQATEKAAWCWWEGNCSCYICKQCTQFSWLFFFLSLLHQTEGAHPQLVGIPNEQQFLFRVCMDRGI